MVDKSIILLQRQLDDLKNYTTATTNSSACNGNTVDGWKSSTISILERIFGKDSLKIQEVKSIKLEHSLGFNGPSTYYWDKFVVRAKSFIETCIAELDIMGLPDQGSGGSVKGINLTIVQSQSNKQEIKINVIAEALNHELTGKQQEELQQILDSEETPEIKKSQTIDKLEQFGSAVMSNVIANILTNPAILGS